MKQTTRLALGMALIYPALWIFVVVTNWGEAVSPSPAGAKIGWDHCGVIALATIPSALIAFAVARKDQ